MRDQLSLWVAAPERTPYDLVVFYYSGHGVVAGNEHYPLTADSETKRLKATALPAKDLSGLFWPTIRMTIFRQMCRGDC